MRITHPDKVLFPADGITKRDLAAYLGAVSDAMVRHLRGRPLMVRRYPRGIGEPGFVQQDLGAALPEWMGSVDLAKADGRVEHAVVQNRRGVLWLANQDCIGVHRWLSAVGHLDRPDRLVIDLDPSTAEFEPVLQTARAARDLLNELGLVPFAQTTGSRGIHIVSPLRPEHDFETVRAFAHDVAVVLAARDPDQRTVAVRRARRGDRVYLDVLRNAYGQSAVAPYSVRARPRAPVATPLYREELDDPGLRPDGFTIADVPARLIARGDPWGKISRHARSLSAPRERLDRMCPRAR